MGLVFCTGCWYFGNGRIKLSSMDGLEIMTSCTVLHSFMSLNCIAGPREQAIKACDEAMQSNSHN